MRICLIAHGLPPYELAGVENHVDALGRALGRAGHRVEVFAPRRLNDLPDCSLRREVRSDYAVTWVQVSRDPRCPAEALDPPGVAEAFARFLDRERPEVVHVHHVVRIGLGLLDAVADAGLPLVFTAHDYFATGDRYTLLRPDMRPINGAQTVELQARCELALARLNRHADTLGDYHVGVFPETVEPELAAELSELLDGDPLRAGVSQDEWEEVLSRRERLEQRRRAAFEQVDHWIAPTRFLRAKLVGAGYPEARILHQPYGIELERFRGLPPMRTDSTEPLRVGFIGSMTKHKGIHVLLEAVDRLAPEVRSAVRVDLFGDSTDRVYVERITARAAELGVHVRGAFLEPRLPSLMAELDVLVVPSLWYENFPFVIREAFAAGRLVVASDGGALPESVRDGVDGLLFERGSPGALAAALTRLVQEPGLRQRLLDEAGEVRSIEDQALECCEVYAAAIEVRAARERSAAGPVLPHLKDLSERLDELMHLPMRGLLEQTLARIDSLESELDAPRLPFHAALMGMVDHDLRTPERLRDRAAESSYLRREILSRDESRGALEAQAKWQEGQLEAFTEERDWLRQETEALKLQSQQAQEATGEEREWLKGQIEAATEESKWLRGELEIANKAAQEQGELSELLEGERMRLDAHLLELSQRLDGERAETDELERRVQASQSRLTELRGRVSAQIGTGQPQPTVLEQQLDQLDADLYALETEVAWRRREMEAARSSSRKSLSGFLLRRFAAGRRTASWPAMDSDGNESPGDSR